ncbi:MAG: hypothetical protein J6K88_03970 [Oscillospiraceae bacterium]|nr:hypothetical protein [Oscillospiraceae bacterium]
MNGLIVNRISEEEILSAYEKGYEKIIFYSPKGGLYLNDERHFKIKEITYAKAREFSKKGFIDIEPRTILAAERCSLEIEIKGQRDERPTIIRGYVSHS